MAETSELNLRPVTPDSWADIKALFGPRGACGGCWCQWPMLALGERMEAIKGALAEERLRGQITSGGRSGVLCYEGQTPVGWASYGPRRAFAQIDRSRIFACDDADEVWSIPCFFVRTSHRKAGVGTALLRAAVDHIAAAGGRIVEGYPIVTRPGERLSAAFAWTGTPSLFEKAGFGRVDDKASGKVRMRLTLP